MLKKFIVFFVILIISFSLSNVGHATDILMNLNTNAPTNITDTNDNRTQNSDNTIYSSEVDFSDTENVVSEEVSTTTSTDYDETTDLSISNIINIVLIAVGIVLILLGIAIIIKLK